MCGGGHGGLLAPGQPPPPGLGVRGRVSFPRLLNRSGAASKGQTQACSRHHGRRQPGWARGSGAGTGRVKLATTGEQGWGLEGWRAENPAGHGASGYPRLHHAQQPQKHGPVLRRVPSTHALGPSTETERAGRLCHQRGRSLGQLQRESHSWDRARGTHVPGRGWSPRAASSGSSPPPPETRPARTLPPRTSSQTTE